MKYTLDLDAALMGDTRPKVAMALIADAMAFAARDMHERAADLGDVDTHFECSTAAEWLTHVALAMQHPNLEP